MTNDKLLGRVISQNNERSERRGVRCHGKPNPFIHRTSENGGQ